ncbi:hypothetical protein PoB_003484100 [Plakobranchus ocellatus]|uniref:C2 domain-containing protein n=1 Tax=Plakobranchus ocellatus TaxID=259542 RepID=A0AAV4AAY9_9GAST|nr:hypothetical protein PoB_003484100 [Plakobranchus ocellatus]
MSANSSSEVANVSVPNLSQSSTANNLVDNSSSVSKLVDIFTPSNAQRSSAINTSLGFSQTNISSSLMTANRSLDALFINSSLKPLLASSSTTALPNVQQLAESINKSSWFNHTLVIVKKGDIDATAVSWNRDVTYDIDLDDLDKALIIGGVAFILLLVLVLMVCILNPNCPLHALCPIDYNDGCKKEKKSPGPLYGSMDDPIFEKNVTNSKSQKKNQGHDGHAKHVTSKARHHNTARPALWPSNKTLRESSEASDWSDVSLPEIIELKQETHGKFRKSNRTSDYSSSASSIPSPVQPESRLAYGLTFDRAHNKLYIRVIQLGNFRVTDPDGALSPYIKVRVYRTPRHFFTFKIRIQRRTDNPVFNDYFELTVDEPDVTAYTVKFLVCDYDKFSRHVVVGEVIVELSKVDLAAGEEVLANDLIENHHEENLGELHVALMYLPTAEKLSVSILNAKGLSTLEPPKRITEVIVKIVLMYDGRPLKKTKTSPTHNDSNPVFNETFVFDVPAYQLDKVYFHLALIASEKEHEEIRHLLGRVYIGVNFDQDARAQWLEMVHNTRKQVASWHKLHG